MKKAFFWVGLICLGLWLGVPVAKEAIKRNDGKRCHENIIYIENGKKRYIQNLSYQKNGKTILPENPKTYIDLIPYMPLKNIPECPCGKPYLHVLELDHQTTCQVNGIQTYEPVTTNVSLVNNGYHDLSKPAEATPLWHIPPKMLGLKPKQPKSPFQN